MTRRDGDEGSGGGSALSPTLSPRERERTLDPNRFDAAIQSNQGLALLNRIATAPCAPR